MPAYYIPNMVPEVVYAATPLEAAVASGIWESGGWAAEYEKHPETFRARHFHIDLTVEELTIGGDVCCTHTVPLIAILNGFGRVPPARRLEEY